MRVVLPSTPRHRLEDTGASLNITFSPILPRVVSALYLVGALPGIVIVGVLLTRLWGMLLGKADEFDYMTYADIISNHFMLKVLVEWFVLSLPLLYLFWQIRGCEKVEVNRDFIVLDRPILWLRRPRKYLAEHIKGLRLLSSSFALPAGGGVIGGPIAFDYGAATCCFGNAVCEAEGKHLVSVILQRFPNYGKD